MKHYFIRNEITSYLVCVEVDSLPVARTFVEGESIERVLALKTVKLVSKDERVTIIYAGRNE